MRLQENRELQNRDTGNSKKHIRPDAGYKKEYVSNGLTGLLSWHSLYFQWINWIYGELE